jgi:hypothetical protein
MTPHQVIDQSKIYFAWLDQDYFILSEGVSADMIAVRLKTENPRFKTYG